MDVESQSGYEGLRMYDEKRREEKARGPGEREKINEAAGTCVGRWVVSPSGGGPFLGLGRRRQTRKSSVACLTAPPPLCLGDFYVTPTSSPFLDPQLDSTPISWLRSPASILFPQLSIFGILLKMSSSARGRGGKFSKPKRGGELSIPSEHFPHVPLTGHLHRWQALQSRSPAAQQGRRGRQHVGRTSPSPARLCPHADMAILRSPSPKTRTTMMTTRRTVRRRRTRKRTMTRMMARQPLARK
jgi:hypothetical protein